MNPYQKQHELELDILRKAKEIRASLEWLEANRNKWKTCSENEAVKSFTQVTKPPEPEPQTPSWMAPNRTWLFQFLDDAIEGRDGKIDFVEGFYARRLEQEIITRDNRIETLEAELKKKE